MRAVAVSPGQPNSAHLREIPTATLEDIPDGRGVLVKVLRVGLDGTNREINAAEYGAAPLDLISWRRGTKALVSWSG